MTFKKKLVVTVALLITALPLGYIFLMWWGNPHYSLDFLSPHYMRTRIKEQDYEKVKIGMSAKEVIAQWGLPHRVHRKKESNTVLFRYYKGIFVVGLISVEFGEDGRVIKKRTGYG